MMETKKRGEVLPENLLDKVPDNIKILEEYSFESDGIPIKIRIYQKKGEYVRTYDVSIAKISKSTLVILEKIREKIIEESTLGSFDIFEKEGTIVEDKFKQVISSLIDKYFPATDEKSKYQMTTFLVQRSLGLGSLEILNNDVKLEEIAINGSDDFVWVYHLEHGWIKTNIMIEEEEQIKHYAQSIGRKVGRQISIGQPMMDANLSNGDRLNATLKPISTKGNTFTLRKFQKEPWTITNFINKKTISAEAASVIWQAIEYELSCLVVGGTATGKTSMLNVISNFFPPNQRIISIEDIREIQLPKHCHWVPLATRLPNPEGKGSVTMLDLLLNSLRMRPDRITVGEVRSKSEADTLFEAIHTGHSVYATLHANDIKETISRLKTPPMEISPSLISGLGLVIVQFRNRRLGLRRTFQIAEVLENGDYNVLYQYDIKKDTLRKVGKSKRLMSVLKMYAGYTQKQLEADLKQKQKVLNYLIRKNITAIDDVGHVMAEYYTDRKNFLKTIRTAR